LEIQDTSYLDDYFGRYRRGYFVLLKTVYMADPPDI
jgi:hypothetical protein